MYNFIIILTLIVSVLLVLVVLAQTSKGGDTAMSGASNKMIGSRKKTDPLEKITWSLISTILFLVVISNFFTGGGRTVDDMLDSPNIRRTKDKPAVTTPPKKDQKPAENKDAKKTEDKKTEDKK